MVKTIWVKERFAIKHAVAEIIGNVICFAHDTHSKLGTDTEPEIAPMPRSISYRRDDYIPI